MACFITPLLTGIVVSLARRLLKKTWLRTLEVMLIGGSLVLLAEHAWSGEVVPYPPFLTSMKDPGATTVLLHEVGVVGGSMTLAVAALWLSLVYVSRKLEVKARPLRPVTVVYSPQ